MISSFVDFMILSFCSVSSKSARKSSSADVGGESAATAESEFISDKFKATNERDLAEIQENMTRLGLTASKEAATGT